MEEFTKNNGTRLLRHRLISRSSKALEAAPLFFEIEPIDLSAHTICRRHGAARGGNIFKYFSNRQIAHEIVCDHVSGRGDPLVV